MTKEQNALKEIENALRHGLSLETNYEHIELLQKLVDKTEPIVIDIDKNDEVVGKDIEVGSWTLGWIECPECGEETLYNPFIKYCAYCAKRIDIHKIDTKKKGN